MFDKNVELDYTPDLNRKIINKIGVPGDNLPENLMQYMCKHYENDMIIVGKRILVIRMLDLAKQYAVKNSVTYITDNKEKYDEFLKAINNKENYGEDDSVELIEDWNSIGEIVKNMPKFDFIIGNPPYGQHGMGSLDLHYEIAESLFGTYNNKMIFVMPGRVCFSTSEKFDAWKKKFNNLSELENCGNPFGEFAAVGVDIFTFENHSVDKVNVRGKIYKSLLEITPFSDYENQFMRKLFNAKPNYNAYRPLGTDKNENAEQFNNNYFNRFNNNSILTISCIANGSKIGQGYFLSSTDTKYIFNKNELKQYLIEHNNFCKVISEFSSETSAKNYINALQRPLMRFGLAKMQDDQSMTARCYQYIPNIDWNDSKTQTDEGILEMVGCTKENAKEFVKYVKDYMDKVDEEHQPKRKKKSK